MKFLKRIDDFILNLDLKQFLIILIIAALPLPSIFIFMKYDLTFIEKIIVFGSISLYSSFFTILADYNELKKAKKHNETMKKLIQKIKEENDI